MIELKFKFIFNIKEYYQGHQYIENHRCQASVQNGILSEVSCKHESTLRGGSRGDNGLQAVAELNLSLKSKNVASSVVSLDRSAPLSIVHDYEPEVIAKSNFNVANFVENVCKNTNNGVLDAQHAQNFRELVFALKSKSKIELVQLVNDATNKCKLAG